MAAKGLTKEQKTEIEKIVNEFNDKNFGTNKMTGIYAVKFKGKFIYLSTLNVNGEEPACRLEYNGDINDLEFEIYKFSRSSYSDDIFMMPGESELDGTVNGALHCILEIYPPN